MTVTRSTRTELPSVEQSDDGTAAHNHNAGVLKEARSSRSDLSQFLIAAWGPKPPQCDFVEVVRRVREKALADEQRNRSQGGAGESASLSVRRKEAPSIVVAEKREIAAITQQRREEFRHAGKSIAIRGGQVFQQGMKRKHVERVNVVIGGLFKVAAIWLYA